MLLKRIITALALAPLAIWAIFYMSLEHFAYFIMVVMAIGAWEWGPLMGFKNNRRRLAFVVATVTLISLLWYQIPLFALWQDPMVLNQHVSYLLWLAVVWWLLSATLTFLYPRCSKFWSSHRSVRGLFGWLTLVPTWLAFMVLRTNHYQDDPYHGAQLIMFLFLMVWAADIGAYFVGKSIGKHKLMPNVSPGKTMEGFIGGVIFACILIAIAGYFLDWQSKQYLTAIGVTALITTISVLGDLNESMFKRQAGIKDSGSILPGHGGVLDRIDSLTATAPIFALCYAFFGWS
ncbi:MULTISPECIES: phosphatidate cytidylyltransferase [Thalassotalea]|uniref:phosphatidate cytidylyltransferase n=1 Tax=Thalassotalea TaxID=1518149 RepID=UPI0009451D48|nr:MULTISPECIES: phosphatidate cytidylyltransferase [Thalassotalea]MDO6426734.1 phosphatidate cytidylyltransferase [Thalassotalea sp. 1_MG-2023]OKY26383.1 phosphatidate cytidylyltransferase [Thalassotalea sp. PP2-459]